MSKYVRKKVPLTAEQVAAIPPEHMEKVFGQLRTRLARGQSTEGMEELLKKVAQHPEKVDLNKAYNLGGFSARYKFFKKLEQNRLWEKELPTDYAETPINTLDVDDSSDSMFNACKNNNYSVEFVIEKENYLYWLNEFKKNSADYLQFILYSALNGNEKCVSCLNELVTYFDSAGQEIHELLKYSIYERLEEKYEKKRK